MAGQNSDRRLYWSKGGHRADSNLTSYPKELFFKVEIVS